MKDYCTQNEGHCLDCSLTNYGKDCRNNPIREIMSAQLSWGEYAAETGVDVTSVEALCKTATTFRDYDSGLASWLECGSYDGTETPQSLAEEWDRMQSEADAEAEYGHE